VHHRVARQADAGVLFRGLHDDGEAPLHAGHVFHALHEPGAGRHAQAGALQQTHRHVLVAAQPQGQGVRPGNRKAHHAHECGDAHFVKRAVHDVVELVEDHVRLQACQLALKPQHVVGQRQHRDAVTEASQRARARRRMNIFRSSVLPRSSGISGAASRKLL
jgi:hypothetical protein